jgi:group I intron endonuclease
MNIYSIYKATNKITGKSYIGFDSHWPKRMNEHKNTAKNTKSKRFHRFHASLHKHGFHNFEWTILYQSKNGEHCLKEMEPYFIKQYNTLNDGYNHTLGGEGTLGYRHTEETKNKLKVPKTKQHKEKMSIAKKGKISDNFLKMQVWLKNNQNTPEFGKKISQANSQKWILIHKNGEEKIVNSLLEFCIQNNFNRNMFYSLSAGRKKSYKGWIVCIKQSNP